MKVKQVFTLLNHKKEKKTLLYVTPMGVGLRWPQEPLSKLRNYCNVATDPYGKNTYLRGRDTPNIFFQHFLCSQACYTRIWHARAIKVVWDNSPWFFLWISVTKIFPTFYVFGESPSKKNLFFEKIFFSNSNASEILWDIFKISKLGARWHQWASN